MTEWQKTREECPLVAIIDTPVGRCDSDLKSPEECPAEPVTASSLYSHYKNFSCLSLIITWVVSHTLQFVPPFVLSELNNWVQLPVFCHKSEIKCIDEPHLRALHCHFIPPYAPTVSFPIIYSFILFLRIRHSEKCHQYRDFISFLKHGRLSGALWMLQYLNA